MTTSIALNGNILCAYLYSCLGKPFPTTPHPRKAAGKHGVTSAWESVDLFVWITNILYHYHIAMGYQVFMILYRSQQQILIQPVSMYSQAMQR